MQKKKVFGGDLNESLVNTSNSVKERLVSSTFPVKTNIPSQMRQLLALKKGSTNYCYSKNLISLRKQRKQWKREWKRSEKSKKERTHHIHSQSVRMITRVTMIVRELWIRWLSTFLMASLTLSPSLHSLSAPQLIDVGWGTLTPEDIRSQMPRAIAKTASTVRASSVLKKQVS